MSESAMLAKEQLVAEYGIGEPLPLTVSGWVDDQVVVTCNIPSNRNPGILYVKAAEAMSLLRKAWGATAMTLVCEGFHTDAPLEGDPRVEFIAGNPKVMEAILITHAQIEGVGYKSIPFTYRLGRKVEFGSPVLQVVNLQSCGPYPATMWNSLRDDFEFGVRPRAIRRLRKIGVEVHEFL